MKSLGYPTLKLRDPIRLLGDHPPLPHHHRLQLTDTRAQPLDHHLQRPGTQINDAFCPHDYPELIIDDELRELFDGIKTGVDTTFICDCCFSEEITGFAGTDTDSGSPETGIRSFASSLGSGIKPPADIGKNIQA
jgi:hypothetical protein